MRSCVDLPDPSDHSTMISVPGRSLVEKNMSFFGVEEIDFVSGTGFFFRDGAFFCIR
jgi:hypothetical protein